MKKKLTQREAIFYRLYKHFKDTETREKYIPIFEFMGEVYCPELGLWGYVSHECSARMSEIRVANPELMQAITITGKSGAKYYGHRFNPNANADMILDPELKRFYQKIKSKQ